LLYFSFDARTIVFFGAVWGSIGEIRQGSKIKIAVEFIVAHDAEP